MRIKTQSLTGCKDVALLGRPVTWALALKVPILGPSTVLGKLEKLRIASPPKPSSRSV